MQVELPRRNGDGASPMETDDASEGTADCGGGGGVAALDFSRLKKQYKATVGAKERGVLAVQFESDIEEKKGLLERVAPNLKVRFIVGSGFYHPSPFEFSPYSPDVSLLKSLYLQPLRVP